MCGSECKRVCNRNERQCERCRHERLVVLTIRERVHRQLTQRDAVGCELWKNSPRANDSLKKGEKGVTPFYANLTLLRCHFSHNSRCFKSLLICTMSTHDPAALCSSCRFSICGRARPIFLANSLGGERELATPHSGCTSKSWQIIHENLHTHMFRFRCQN